MFYVLGAYFLDLILGSLRFLKAPIKLLNVFIVALEKFCVRFIKAQWFQKLFGLFIVAIVVFIPYFLVLWLLLAIMDYKAVFIAVSVYLLFLSISSRQLSSEARQIYRALKEDDLAKAKALLKRATGKNTDFYTRETVIRVCIEHISRGIVEDITAPLFYAFFGGAPLAFLYRTTNMLGKRMDFEDEGFVNIRRCGTLTDDALGYIPTRLTVLVMYLACLFLRLPRKRFWRGLYKDVRSKISLNDVYPQSIVARRLGILLGNGAGGVSIGEYRREIRESDILKAVSIMRMTAFLFILICSLIMGAILYIYR